MTDAFGRQQGLRDGSHGRQQVDAVEGRRKVVGDGHHKIIPVTPAVACAGNYSHTNGTQTRRHFPLFPAGRRSTRPKLCFKTTHCTQKVVHKASSYTHNRSISRHIDVTAVPHEVVHAGRRGGRAYVRAKQTTLTLAGQSPNHTL